MARDPLTPELTVPITNVTAYVRKGEAEDKLNGRINWRDNYLYKFIDLTLLTRVFRVFNEEEGEAVYLERTTKKYPIFYLVNKILKQFLSQQPRQLLSRILILKVSISKRMLRRLLV